DAHIGPRHWSDHGGSDGVIELVDPTVHPLPGVARIALRRRHGGAADQGESQKGEGGDPEDRWRASCWHEGSVRVLWRALYQPRGLTRSGAAAGACWRGIRELPAGAR